MLVTDGRGRPPEDLARVASTLAACGVRLALQLREKQLAAAELLDRARRLRARLAAASPPVLLVINGRFDVALAAAADGVHLPAAGPPPGRVREAVGTRLRIGVSTHSADEARRAAAAGADYVVFGPVYDTPSKRGLGRPHGLEGLRAAVAAARPAPLLAIGGVTPANAAGCLEAGAHGVAMMRALLDPADPAGTARALPEALRPAGGGSECSPPY